MHRLRKLILGVAAGATLAQAAFDPCKFNFGESWEGPSASYAAQTDYVTIWVGDGGGQSNYNTYWEGDMLKKCKAGSGHAIAGKTPVLYSYIIAFLAKNKGGLKDCDVAGMGSSSSLCVNGAKYIRENRALILQKYGEFAAGAAKDYGTTNPIIWLLEPDFLQYHEATSYWGTQGNPLTLAEAGTLMTDIIAKIKSNLPNAQISFDISPWLGGASWQAAHTEWLNAMPKSSFNFRNTSGGRTQGDQARIRSDANNLTTWAGISKLSGLQIIADDGYGVGGASNSDWYEWMSASALNSRIADGVVALSIQKPAGDYNSKITAIRSSLDKPNCSGGGGWTPGKTQFKLTTSGTNGTVTLSPAGGTYDSGTTVIATATPKAGYTFTKWASPSQCTGTGPCTIVMTGDELASATFTAHPKLTVTTMGTGTGTVTSSPAGISCGTACEASFTPGASVTLTAVASSGNSFSGWSGACTGTSTCTVSMTAAKSVTATFATGGSSTTPSKFSLTTTATNGTIALSPAGGTYDSAKVVTATATPATGYLFSGWSGACTGTGACSITMNANKTLTASFTKSTTPVKTFKLTATATNGTIALSPAGGTYDSGTSVTLTATPTTGYQFASWSGACSGTDPVCTLTMNAAKTATASFTAVATGPMRTINTNNPTDGTIVFSPAGPSFAEGTVVTVTVLPKSGFAFDSWQGACSGSGTCTITIPNYDPWLGATFKTSTSIGGRMQNGQRLTMTQGQTLTFDPTNLGYSHLELFSTQGKSIPLWQGQGSSVSQISLQNLTPGLYFARLRGTSESFQQLIQIIR